MIRTLRKKFILTATLALLFVLLVVVGVVNWICHGRVNEQIQATIQYIYENGGEMPAYSENAGENAGKNLLLTPESQYETRYFSVILNLDGSTEKKHTDHIADVDEERATELAQELLETGRDHGTFSNGRITYTYGIFQVDEDSTMIVCVDSTRENWIVRQIVLYVQAFSLAIFIIFFLVITLMAGRVMKPMEQSMEKQKQFITNASHELKTPLAVISANTELLEVMNGKNEWTESTMRQINRLNGLVAELITLARLEEQEDLPLTDVDFTQIVRETAEAFRPVVEQQDKGFSLEAADSVTIKGEDKALRELVSILLDNAAKYCDADGSVAVRLSRRTRDRGANLSVSNSYAAGKGVDYKRFFDRFYREDPSRNSQKSGYGIGLSMAREIVRHMNGKLSVGFQDGRITFTAVF